MQMWLTRPREFEMLDQAINDACCRGDLDTLKRWAEMLKDVVAGNSAEGIGNQANLFGWSGDSHFYRHWVGDYDKNVPPEYWPHAWGNWKPGTGTADQRLRIDRLVSFGLEWSIRKVLDARIAFDAGMNDDDRPACSACRTHMTVWVCTEIPGVEPAYAAADLEYRRSRFRVGVVESRDSVMLVISTPRPLGLSGGVCDPTKPIVAKGTPGAEALYKEPVLVTRGFTADEVPKWTQPIANAETVLQPGYLAEVNEQPLTRDGKMMPNGLYPDDVDTEHCVFVPLATKIGKLAAESPEALIKEILRKATTPEFALDGTLDMSEELIKRLRISIADEDDEDDG